MKYLAILFDMNGVVVNDEHLQEQAITHSLSTVNIVLAHADYEKYFVGKTDMLGFSEFLSTEDVEQLVQIKRNEYERLASTQQVVSLPGVKDLILELKKQSIKVGLVTSAQQAEAHKNLHALGLFSYFDVIITSKDITESKPSPEGYLLAATELSVRPDTCIVIEDTVSGIDAGNRAGMYTIAVTNTLSSEALSAADQVVERLSINMLSSI